MKKYTHIISERLTGRHKRCMQLCGVKGKRILNIGCSFGWFEMFALKNGCKEIIGVDTGINDLKDAKNKVKDNRVKFLQASALNLSQFKNNYFDLVTLFDVIEHIPKNTEMKCLLEVKRVLKKNGELIISTPNSSFFSNLLDPAWYFGHRHYSKNKLNQILNKSGFKCVEYTYGGGFYEIFAMILLYIFKWIFRYEIPFKKWFDEKRDNEYISSKNNVFTTLFVKAIFQDKDVKE
ncbi:MAG: hypothetical protein DRN71_02855 [Candidatus Nanohalarchaeota archaeon]|nr:MAG: hypothetical protein DRN71_02855 [Candidatus Nanohaloarchaeota archaeon]